MTEITFTDPTLNKLDAISISEEELKIGRELQTFLATIGKTRGEFAQSVGLAKGTIDKMCSGRFSKKTLATVQAKSKFVLSNSYAASALGRYPRSSWEAYIGQYIMIEPVIDRDDAVSIRTVKIEWSNSHGLVLSTRSGQEIGKFIVPHERTALLYIKSDKEGLYFAISTMVGEKAMRGLKLSVQNEIANAYIPTVAPVVFMSAPKDGIFDKRFPKTVALTSDDPNFAIANDELTKVIEHKYAKFIGAGA